MRARLIALAAAATIPIAAIAGSNAWTAYKAAMEQGPRDALILREVAAARHGAAVDALIEVVSGLARDGNLLEMPQATCDATLETLRMLTPDRYSNFWVLDGQGVLLCSALPGPHGHSYADLGYVAEMMRTRAFTLAEFTIGVLSGRAVLPGMAPVLGPDGALQAMVGGGLFLDFFLRSSEAAQHVRRHDVWLLDQDGDTLPIGSAVPDGLPPPAQLAELIGQGSATVEGDARNGLAHAWSAERLAPGLHLLVGLPVEQNHQAARQVLQRRLAELAVFLLACLGAILIGVEWGVARPMRRLAARVREWRPGHPYLPQPDGTMPAEVRDLDGAVATAAAALRDREDALTAALRQRDLLMAEIHHRVKNNLQIVASLLSLQAERVRSDAARREFAAARDRVQALAMLHRHLYLNQSFERMSVRPFLEDLARQLGDALGAGRDNDVSIRIEADDIELGADQSISLALLLTEVVSNAIRHAFPDGRAGTITITLTVEDQEATLCVRDDGIGLGEAERAGDGLGTQLIQGFASHLGGEVEITDQEGTCVTIRFPLPEPAEMMRGAA